MLDPLDRKLLMALQHDARRTNADLAEEVGLSVSACAKRVARFWSDGLIARSVARLDRRKFKRPVTATVMVSLTAPKANVSQEFARRICAYDAVQQCHVVTGDFDFLLIVQERSIEAYHDFAQEVFGEWASVADYKTVFLLRSYKNENTLPEFCLTAAE
ncbi:Lrp/AsnC family transcriptional regulator [Pseudooceanicola sp. 502str34]